MKTIILTVGFLLSISLISGQRLEDNCSKDSDCGNSLVCKNNKCSCGVGYNPTPESGQICTHVIGANCYSNDDCKNMPGAECESNRCHCRGGLIAGVNECVKIGKENEECTQTSVCILRVDPPDNNKECNVDKKCVCKGGYHEGNNKRCKLNRGLNEVCELDECFVADSQNNNALECANASDGQGKACRCKSGYVEEGGVCNGSATIFILSVSSLLLVIMAVLKM